MDDHNAPRLHIMRSELGRAQGRGAAKSGVAHWWGQRVTAIALLPLSLYFVVSVLMLAGADHDQVARFMAAPWNTVLYLCLIAALFYHLALGVQVVIEDYVSNEAKRLASLLAVKGIIVFCALASAVAVLKLAF